MQSHSPPPQISEIVPGTVIDSSPQFEADQLDDLIQGTTLDDVIIEMVPPPTPIWKKAKQYLKFQPSTKQYTRLEDVDSSSTDQFDAESIPLSSTSPIQESSAPRSQFKTTSQFLVGHEFELSQSKFNISVFLTEFFAHLIGPIALPFLYFFLGKYWLMNRGFWIKPFKKQPRRFRTPIMQYITYIMVYIVNFSFIFSKPIAFSIFELVLFNMMVVIRNAIIAIKYAHCSDLEIYAMKMFPELQNRQSSRQVISGWFHPSDATLFKEILGAAYRQQYDPRTSYFRWKGDPSETKRSVQASINTMALFASRNPESFFKVMSHQTPKSTSGHLISLGKKTHKSTKNVFNKLTAIPNTKFTGVFEDTEEFKRMIELHFFVDQEDTFQDSDGSDDSDDSEGSDEQGPSSSNHKTSVSSKKKSKTHIYEPGGGISMVLIALQFFIDARESIRFDWVGPIAQILSLVYCLLAPTIRIIQNDSLRYLADPVELMVTISALWISYFYFICIVVYLIVGILDYRRRLVVTQLLGSLLVRAGYAPSFAVQVAKCQGKDAFPGQGSVERFRNSNYNLPRWKGQPTLFLDLTSPQNVTYWLRLRNLCFDVGRNYFKRISMYTGLVFIWNIVLVCYLLLYAFFNGIVPIAATIITLYVIIITSCLLLLMVWPGAKINDFNNFHSSLVVSWQMAVRNLITASIQGLQGFLNLPAQVEQRLVGVNQHIDTLSDHHSSTFQRLEKQAILFTPDSSIDPSSTHSDSHHASHHASHHDSISTFHPKSDALLASKPQMNLIKTPNPDFLCAETMSRYAFCLDGIVVEKDIGVLGYYYKAIRQLSSNPEDRHLLVEFTRRLEHCDRLLFGVRQGIHYASQLEPITVLGVPAGMGVVQSTVFIAASGIAAAIRHFLIDTGKLGLG